MPEFRIHDAQGIALCEGRAKACEGLVSPETEEARRGTRIHKALALLSHKKPVADGILHGEEEVACVDLLWDDTARFISSLGSEIQFGPMCEVEVEVAGWKGHPDYVAMLADNTLVVIDWKSGRSYVPPAPKNAQLRGYAPGAAKFSASVGWPMCSRVIAVILQPYEEWKSCQFTPRDLDAAADDLRKWREAALKKDAKRKPSALACLYCPAFGTDRCPESMKKTTALAIHSPVSIESASPEKLCELFGIAKAIAPMAKRVEEEIRRRLAIGQKVGDLVFGKPARIREIIDFEKAVRALMLAGAKPEDIWKICSLSIPKAEKLVGKQKAASALSEFIKTSYKAPSIEYA